MKRTKPKIRCAEIEEVAVALNTGRTVYVRSFQRGWVPCMAGPLHRQILWHYAPANFSFVWRGDLYGLEVTP